MKCDKTCVIIIICLLIISAGAWYLSSFFKTVTSHPVQIQSQILNKNFVEPVVDSSQDKFINTHEEHRLGSVEESHHYGNVFYKGQQEYYPRMQGSMIGTQF
jgi:predicted neuraminidase